MVCCLPLLSLVRDTASNPSHCHSNGLSYTKRPAGGAPFPNLQCEIFLLLEDTPCHSRSKYEVKSNFMNAQMENKFLAIAKHCVIILKSLSFCNVVNGKTKFILAQGL